MKNSSNAEVSVAMSEPSKFKFESTTCGATLGAGATCDIVVSVTITEEVGFHETLKVIFNGEDEATSGIILSANKVGGSALLKIYPKTLSLIVTDITKRTDENKVTISNVGNATMTLEIPTNNCFDRGSNSNCGSSLEAGRSCNLFYSTNLKEKYDNKVCSNNFFETVYYGGLPDNSSAYGTIMLTTNAENAEDYAYDFSTYTEEEIKRFYPEVGLDNISKAIISIDTDTDYKPELISFYNEEGDLLSDNNPYYDEMLTKDVLKTYSVKVHNNSNSDIKLDNLTDDIDFISDLDPYADYRFEQSSTCKKGYTLKSGKTCTIVFSVIINEKSYKNFVTTSTGINLFIKKGTFTIDESCVSDFRVPPYNKFRFTGDEYKCREYDKDTVAVKFSLGTK